MLLEDIKIPCKLLGIVGNMGVGKDTAANYLFDKYKNVYIEAFADHLKTVCAAMFSLPEEVWYDQELKQQVMHPWGVSPRKILQLFGTEVIRDNIHKIFSDLPQGEFWARWLALKLSANLPGCDVRYDENDTIIIPDVRFENEAKWILDNGGQIIWLSADWKEPVNTHASEQLSFLGNLDDSEIYTITNIQGNLPHLYESVDKIYRDLAGQKLTG